MNKGNILYVHHGDHRGGAAISMLNTMLIMRSLGFSPMAALIHPNDKLHKLYNKHNIPTFESKYLPNVLTCAASEGKLYNPVTWLYLIIAAKDWRRAKKLFAKEISSLNIQLVHANSVCLSILHEICSENRIPFVWHVREQGPTNKSFVFYFIQRRLMRCQSTIFLSKAEKSDWLGKNSVNGHVIANFIDTKTHKPISASKKIAIRREKNIPEDAKVLVFLGGLKKYKGAIELIEMLYRLNNETKHKLICLMPGADDQGKYAKNVISRIKKHKLEEVCILSSFESNISNLICLSDVLVAPNMVDHFSRPALEAGALGIPVIISDFPISREQVTDGENGLLFEPGDIDKFCSLTKRVLDNSKLAKSLGEMGRCSAIMHNDTTLQAQKILKIYEETIKEINSLESN